MVATHLTFCAECRAATGLVEAIGGAVLMMTPPAWKWRAFDALVRALHRLHSPPANAFFAPRREMLAGGLAVPETLRDLVPAEVATARARRKADEGQSGPAGGCRPASDPRRRESTPGSSGVAAVKSLPEHGHRGWEATCVLSGRFTDLTGEYGPGDVAEMDENLTHRPVAGPDAACICLIAWNGGPRMSGLLAGLALPLLGC